MIHLLPQTETVAALFVIGMSAVCSAILMLDWRRRYFYTALFTHMLIMAKVVTLHYVLGSLNASAYDRSYWILLNPLWIMYTSGVTIGTVLSGLYMAYRDHKKPKPVNPLPNDPTNIVAFRRREP